MADITNPFNDYQTVITKGNGKTNDGTVIKRNLNGMDQDAFVKILVAEMSHQSPDNPQDSTQFVAQMAQFSSVQQMVNLNRTMTFNSASNTIGKFVTLKDVDGDGKPIRGLVHKVARSGDNITMFVQLIDSNNKPVYQQKYDSNGNPLKDDKGNPLYETVPKYNADGTPAKDDKGNQLFEPVNKVLEFPYADIASINDGIDAKDTQALEDANTKQSTSEKTTN